MRCLIAYLDLGISASGPPTGIWRAATQTSQVMVGVTGDPAA